jgi:hypothetical protein
MRIPLYIPALLAALACGCETAPAPRAPESSPAEAPEITKDVAVDMARRDVAVHFRELGVSFVNVQRAGRFWVIEFRGPSGHGLHYAISRNDGSIRERTVVQ